MADGGFDFSDTFGPEWDIFDGSLDADLDFTGSTKIDFSGSGFNDAFTGTPTSWYDPYADSDTENYGNEGRSYINGPTDGPGGSPINASQYGDRYVDTNAGNQQPNWLDKALGIGGKLLDSRTGAALINTGGGIISNYFTAKELKEREDASRARKIEGYRSGAGMTLLKRGS